MARLIDRLDPHEVLAGSSGLLLVHGIGAALGPLAAGLAMAALGPDALPMWFALTQGVLALLTSSLLRRVPAQIALQTRFQPMVRTTSTAFELAGTGRTETDSSNPETR